MKSKKIRKNLLLPVLLLVGLIGGAYAYFSASADTVENVFEVATGQKDEAEGLEIVEPSWNGEAKRGGPTVYRPGSYIAKDPSIISKVNYDGYAIMRVRIHKVMSIEDKSAENESSQEKLNEIAQICYFGAPQIVVGSTEKLTPDMINTLGDLKGINTGDNNKGTYNSNDYVFLGKLTVRDEYNDYYFGYNDLLYSGNRTENLFDYIQIKDFDKLLNDNQSTIGSAIDIDARMIQSIDEDTGLQYKGVEDAWNKVYKKPPTSEEFGAVDDETSNDSALVTPRQQQVYDVIYNGNGATENYSYKQGKGNASLEIAKNKFTKPGHTFVNWNTAADGSGDTYEPGMHYLNNEVSNLYAQWEKEKFYITYNLNGGTASNKDKYDIDTETFTLTNPEKEGYTFTGWSGTDLEGEENMAVTIQNGDLQHRNYEAHWKINQYDVTTAQGKGIQSTTGDGNYDYHAEVALGYTLKPGYDFDKWVSDETTITDGKIIVPAKNTTVTATATPRNDTKYVVYHQKEQHDGSWKTIDTDNLMGTTDTQVTPALKAYTGFEQPEAVEINIDGDGLAELTYQYPIIRYDVKLTKSNGIDTLTGEGRYKYDESVNITCTIKDGYRFTGFTGDKTSNNTSISFNMPANTLNIAATTEKIPYTISYDLAGGTAVGTMVTDFDVESEKIVINDPTREGYTFDGWTGSNGETPEKNLEIPSGSTENRNYVANWTPIEYTIIYELHDGTITDIIDTYNIETETFKLQTPAKEGLNFDGWTGSNGDERQTEVTISKGTIGDKTYEAHWVKGGEAYVIKRISDISTQQLAAAMKGYLDDVEEKDITGNSMDAHGAEAEIIEEETDEFPWVTNVNSSIGSITFKDGGKNINFKGNRTNAGSTAMWYVPTQGSEQKFTFDYTLDFGDSFKSAGFLLRVKDSNPASPTQGTISGYALVLGYSRYTQSQIAKFTRDKNTTANFNWTTVQTLNINQTGTLTATATNTYIEISGGGISNLKVPLDTNYVLNNCGAGYGFYSDHFSHSCDRIGNFDISNLQLVTTTVLSMSDVINANNGSTGDNGAEDGPIFERPDAIHFIINIDTKVDPYLQDTTLINRLKAENAHVIFIGSSENKTNAQQFINSVGAGTFIMTTGNVQQDAENAAEYMHTILKAAGN